MLGIIGAMDIEVESLKALLTNKTEESISGIDFCVGDLGNEKAVVAKCGIGKVFSAICTEAMILKYKPDMIINIGVAGCLDETLDIGDVVIADSVVQHDMDISPLGDPVGMLSDINIVKIPTNVEMKNKLIEAVKAVGINYSVGVIASGDQFVASDDKKNYIKTNFDAKACEMEGGSIGHVCYVNNVPFTVIRAMSDKANGGATMDFPTFTKIAARNSTNVIKKFVGILEE